MKRKVTAFVLRTRSSGVSELLFHSFVTDPSLPWRLPGGGVDAGETPEHALFRELREETGLSDLRILRKLGVQTYFKPYIQSHVERHDFLLSAPDGVPDTWDHVVQGKGADADDVFRFHWLSASDLTGIESEHRSFITPEYVPELF